MPFVTLYGATLGLNGERNPHEAEGKDLDAQFAHIWWLEGGKITRFQQYTDTAQAIDAVTK